MGTLYRVAKRYETPYSDPIRLARGARVTILPRTSEWPGWVWGRGDDGKTGWVPDAYLRREGEEAFLTRDYDATELSVEAGDTIRPLGELAGWVWGTNERGKTGWVPKDHLEIESPGGKEGPMSEEVFRSPKKHGRIMVLLSGRGSNFTALADAAAAGKINAEIALVFSNKEDAPGLAAARGRGLPTMSLSPKAFADKAAYDRAILREVEARGIDLICLAGYMKVLTPEFCAACKNRILNIHPALLPSFPGLNVQQQAIDWGVRYSGCTVHFVSAEVDMGAIVLQAVVPVLQNDTAETLAARILVEEHKIYPEAARLYFEGRLEIRGRRVTIL